MLFVLNVSKHNSLLRFIDFNGGFMEKDNVVMKPETVNVFNRERVDLVGVIEVLSSTEAEVHAKLENSLLQITGKDLRVVKLVPEERFLSVSGRIDGMAYYSRQTKKSFLSKVFK